MKLLFVGAALLVSVLRTDAQGYAASSFGNYHQQLPDSVPNVPLPPQPQGQADYTVNSYYGNPPPPPPALPSSRFLGDLWQAASSFASNQVKEVQNMLGPVKNWLDNQSQRRYPPNTQNQYNVAPPMGSSQVVYTSGYNGAPPPPHAFSSQVGVASPFNGFAQPPPPPPPSFPAASGQVVYTGSYNGAPPPPLPVSSSQVTYYSGSYGAPPPPPPPASGQVVYSSYGAPPPPPPPAVSGQAGAPSNGYSGPPLPGASIQVGSSSDNNNGPSPANSQPFNAKLQAPAQNVL